MRRVAIALALGAFLAGAATPSRAQSEPPAPKAGEKTQEKRIERLIQQLGDDAYEKREAAQRELEAIGRPALPALRKATSHEDPEVASRAEAIVRAREAGLG